MTDINRDKLIEAIKQGVPDNPNMVSTIGTPMEGRESEIADKMIRMEHDNPKIREAIAIYLNES